MPAATQTLLDDAAVDIEQWVARRGLHRLRRAGRRGLRQRQRRSTSRKDFSLTRKVADASWSFGNIGYVATGVAGNFAASNPSDALIDLCYALRAGYRTNGKFVMSRKTQQAVRKFKATTGEYLWEPPSAANGQPTLMGFPVVEAEDMPDIATGDRSRSPSVISSAAISSSTASASASCAIPIPTSLTCCSTRPSASAAACRILRRSSC